MGTIEVFSPAQVRDHVDRLTQGQFFQGVILSHTNKVIADLNAQGIFLCRFDDPDLLKAIRAAHLQGKAALLRR